MGRDQVSRLMRICGISGVVRGRHHTVTTERDKAATRHPDLIDRQWSAPARPDPVTSKLPPRAGRAFSRQMRLRQIRRRPPQHLHLLLQQPVALPQLTKLGVAVVG